MSFKKFLNSVIFAGAALTGGVQAQTSPVGGLTQNTAVLANHALDQTKSDPNIGKQLLVNNLKFSEKLSDTTRVGITGEYDSKFGGGVSVDGTYNNAENSFAVGALYKKLQNAKYALVSTSKNWGNMNVTGTYSTGSQSAQKAIGREDIDGNLTGDKTTLSLTVREVSFLDNLGVKLSHAKTNETILKKDELITTEISTQDLGQVIRTIDSKYNNITTTSWTGGTDDRVSLVGGMKIGDHHRIDASIGKQAMKILDSHRSYNIGSIGYTYVPTPDTKFNVQYSSSGQTTHQSNGIDITSGRANQVRAEFSHMLASKQGEFVAGVRRDSYSNGIPSSNAIYAGLKLSFGGKNSSYSTNSNRAPRTAMDNLRVGMNSSNFANPQEIGYVDVKQEKKLISETTTYTPKEIPTAFGRVTVNTNGTITVEFGNSAIQASSQAVVRSSQAVLLASSTRSGVDVPTAEVTYALKITKSNSSTDSVGINPPSWTSSVMDEGSYTLVIVTTNTFNGKKTESQSQPYTVTIEKDAKEDIKELQVVTTGYESVLLNYGATDTDGIRNESWKIEGSTVATMEIDKNAKTVLIKGATPGNILTLVYEGEYAEKGPDGKLSWKTFKKTKEVTLLKAVDAVTTVTLDVNNVTTNSLLAACNIVDLDGATGTCTLRTKAGVLVQSWAIGANQSIAGLLPATEYTLVLAGTADEKQANNTIRKISINQLKDFTTVALSAPTTSFGSAVTVNVGSSTFTRTLTTNSPGAITYSSDNTSVATVNSAGLVTIVGPGSTTITANQVAGGVYSATSANYTVNVSTIAPTVSFGSAVTVNVGSSAFTRTLTTNSAGAISYSSSNTGVATVNASGLVTIISAGVATITANQVANGNYSATSANYSVNVSTIAPTVSFGSTVTGHVGDAAFTRTLTTNSAGMVTYTSSNTSVATVSLTTGQVTILGAGSAVITASQVANGNYSATSANYTVNASVAIIAPTVSFGSGVSATVGDAPFTQTLTTNSSGAITYSSNNTSVATVNASGLVTIVGAGVATITANQVANGPYAAASANYSVNVSVALITPTVSFGSAVTANVGDAAFTRTLTTNSPGAVTYSSDNTSVATVNASGLVTIVGAGAANITANQAASGGYSATSANYTVNVNAVAPALTTISGCSVSNNNIGAVATGYAGTVDSCVVALASGVTVTTWQLYSNITNALLASGSGTPPSSIAFSEVPLTGHFGETMKLKLRVTDSLGRTAEENITSSDVII